MNRVIVHIDMDAFFASVEQLDNPELRGRPVIVGGNPFKGRSVVSSASYEARKYGVHAAMPIRRAYKLCPHAVFIRPRFARYEQVSRQIMEILLRFSPLVEPASIDEAYIDLTGTERLFGDPAETALRIKREIKERTGLTASVGVAPNKMVAKIASDKDKPDGFCVVKPNEVKDFLAPLPVTAIPGVGDVLASKLKKLGIETIGDVQKFPREVFKSVFGRGGEELYDMCMGIDNRPVEPPKERKQLSFERTFEKDIKDRKILRQKLLLIADHIAERLSKRELVARTVTLKVRFHDFSMITRSQTLNLPTRSHEIISETAEKLLDKVPRVPIRLLGISVSNLSPLAGRPAEIFVDTQRAEKLIDALIAIRDKYGYTSIKRAFELMEGRE